MESIIRYRIVLGSYFDIISARKKINEMNEKGIDCTIIEEVKNNMVNYKVVETKIYFKDLALLEVNKLRYKKIYSFVEIIN